jgi:hypothetical protein
MRIACLLFLLSQFLPAQDFKFIAGYSGDIDQVPHPGFDGEGGVGAGYLLTYTTYSWDIKEDLSTGTKYFDLTAQQCRKVQSGKFEVINDPVSGHVLDIVLPPPTFECTPLTYANAITLSAIQVALTYFYDLAPGKVPHIINYLGPGPTPLYSPRADLTTLPPNAPVDPRMIYLDELSTNTVVSLDLTNGATLSQVALPNSALGPFGIRANATGPPTEVWVANGGTQVSIVDLTSQTIAATVPISAIPAAAIPAGIVFSNDATTAFEAVAYPSPDSAGNNGALLLFDAVNRTLFSSLPLKYAPATVLMAPDGLTAYLLSASGMITYYDVLSGTADLSLSTYTPGQIGGYPGPQSQVFASPDGTKLYWNVGAQLSVFDLNAHTVTAMFISGLPTTSAASMQMTQDGAQIWFANALGNVAVLDAYSGFVVGNIQNPAGQQLLLPSPTN